MIINQDLSPTKVEAMERIDRRAGETRSLFITSVPGQEGTYMVKRLEAEAVQTYLPIDPPDMSPYPHIAKRIGSIDGSTAQEVAATVLAKANEWLEIGSSIDDARLRAKEAVANAPSKADLTAAETTFETTIAAIVAAAQSA